jgi:hypothetical protein
MARTLVKLISYISVEHRNGLDPRKVNQVVREELGDDFRQILSGIKFKTSFQKSVTQRLDSECDFELISEPALLKELESQMPDS